MSPSVNIKHFYCIYIGICNTDYFRPSQNKLWREHDANDHNLISPAAWDVSINRVLMLRGGEIFEGLPNQGKRKSTVTQTAKLVGDMALDNHNQSQKRMSWISPKRLWTAARNMLRFKRHSDESEDIGKQAEFEELDTIMESSNTIEEDDKRVVDSTGWLDSEPSPPDAPPPGKVWNKRSLRVWINKIQNKFLSNETADALKTIVKVMESFPDYGVVDLLGLYSPKDVILSIIALSRLQTSIPSRIDANADDFSIDSETLHDLSYYVKFAHAAYGWKGLAAFCGRLHLGGDSRALMKRCGIDRRDILMANWHSRANRPAFFLVKDNDKKTLVLSIRGTLSPRDILTDLCANCENFFVEDKSDFVEIGNIDNENDMDMLALASSVMVGRAHKGMIDAAKSIARKTGKMISDELRSASDYSLVIVGHSLGGGVAATLTTMWRRRFKDRVRCIGYGMPCSSPFNDERDKIISVVGEGDPFSALSLGHLSDISKALSQLCQDRGFRDEILRRTASGKMSKDDISFATNAMNCLRKHMKSEKLYPPGTIYLIAGSLFDYSIDKLNGHKERDDKRKRIHRVDSSQFNELKLHTTMFDLIYHIPARYEAILERLVATEAPELEHLSSI